ncbi:hypothetical protein B5C34_09345 [Pacificimonas flava]|uniref:Uncharacterized protein n=2 Tax=Pacificimonas TaxID=1960290 RepID=A0A219B631_9SPHN|nr:MULTISPECIES: tetratricopeptide repeat protein [Pacificimonas]MBZ6379125.1 tetratricopeptide repeat protein [Pacificimonas aurantium]OWV33644.1 hypothetical protein B5C34_09345 [Pacificimonas flava]
MKRIGAFALGLCVAVGAGQVRAQSLQDRYDQAQSAYEAEDWGQAASGFTAVLGELAPQQRNGPVGATVLSRLGDALLSLDREDEAFSRLEQADQLFRDFGDTSLDALFTARRLAAHYESRGLLSEAVDLYRRAASMPDASPVGRASLGLARTLMFRDSDRALAILDRALKALPSIDGMSDEVREHNAANLHLLRGRALLNAGRMDEAVDAYEEAIRIVGSSGRRISLQDSVVRGEASLANLLAGRRSRGLELMQYAGSATEEDSVPPLPFDVALPDCAPVTNIRPDDMMVVEFAIGEDGSVAAISPIYSSRPGEIEEVFLTSLVETLWDPARISEVNPFWRASHKVEVRCVTEAEKLSPLDYFAPAVAELLPGAVLSAEEPTIVDARAALSSLNELAGSLDDVSDAGIPYLVRVLQSKIPTGKDDILEALMATPAITALEPPGQALVWSYFASPYDEPRSRELNRRLQTAMSSETELGRLARSALYLLKARRFEHEDNESAASETYRLLLEEGLPAESLPVSFAKLRLSSLALEEDQAELAQAYLDSTGLSPTQCSLLDADPLIERTNANSSDFPSDMARRGFAGSSLTSYDITSEGIPVNVRTVYSFPPLLFSDPVEKISARMRYNKIYREGGTIGCSAMVQAFRFGY